MYLSGRRGAPGNTKSETAEVNSGAHSAQAWRRVLLIPNRDELRFSHRERGVPQRRFSASLSARRSMQGEQPCDVNVHLDSLPCADEVRRTALFHRFWTLGPLPPLASLRPHSSMRLSSAPPAKTSTQNNVSSQYNIIPTLLANSLFPIAEAPLSKSA